MIRDHGKLPGPGNSEHHHHHHRVDFCIHNSTIVRLSVKSILIVVKHAQDPRTIPIYRESTHTEFITLRLSTNRFY